MLRFKIAFLVATASALHPVRFSPNSSPPPAPDEATAKLTPMSGNKEHPLMPIGTAAPDFSLKGTDDRVYTLSDFSQAKLLVVMFESIHCPVSENYEARMRGLYDAYHDKGVAFVAINPNNPSAVRLDELGYMRSNRCSRRYIEDSREGQARVPWPYLYDGENPDDGTEVRRQSQPHTYSSLIRIASCVAMRDGFDDNQNEKLVKVHDAHDAIEALLAGQEVAVAHRPAFGCSTKVNAFEVG